MLQFHLARAAPEIERACILFDLRIQQAENALAGREPALNVLVHPHQALQRRQQHGHSAEEGHKSSDTEITLQGLPAGHIDDECQGHRSDKFHRRTAGGGCHHRLHAETAVGIDNLAETLRLLLLTAIELDDAQSVHDLAQGMMHVCHGSLHAPVHITQALAQAHHHQRDDRAGHDSDQ
ncbi:MAG: hypothetical protein A3H91_03200 [Gammaproteobacteria bacterium RIFCSPLOWO2_02_FULL_61_13]|nr:MAG: hypothetical protein A3H91_03200 [Gammaproteobacteria bacterium RIFCSPLOWO2_02_FULL_61_13]